MKLFNAIIIVSILTISNGAFAQDTTRVATKDDVAEVKGQVDGINETMLEMKSTVDALKKIKISGYLQAQYQAADSDAVTSFAGGDFPANTHERFSVRRGRLKVNYDNDLTQYVLQIDITQGGVGIKDMYASVKEPWMRAFTFTGGIFDRPFGFEISYSSSNREAPERTRMYQILFPGERELGSKIEFAPESGPLSFLNFKGGLFNGVLNNANENDNNKDFIGRLGVSLPFQEENLAIDGGVSLYSGKVTNLTKYVYSFDNSAPVKKYKVDSTATNTGESFGRAYYGADVQLYYDLPIIGGMSLRSEFITGQQPGTGNLNSFYGNKDVTKDLQKGALYVRKFTGWYINYIQNVGLKNQLVVKYDVWDPNTEANAEDLGAAGSNFEIGDLKYSTLGFGWIYHWDSNVKFVAYYDMVRNEKVNSAATGSLAPYRNDLKDNVFTLRMQYKF